MSSHYIETHVQNDYCLLSFKIPRPIIPISCLLRGVADPLPLPRPLNPSLYCGSLLLSRQVAMRLLEKDIHEKQDTLVSLRRQLQDIKKLNLELHSRLQVGAPLRVYLVLCVRDFRWSYVTACVSIQYVTVCVWGRDCARGNVMVKVPLYVFCVRDYFYGPTWLRTWAYSTWQCTWGNVTEREETRR